MNSHPTVTPGQARDGDLPRSPATQHPSDPSDDVVVDADRLLRLGSRVLVLRGPLLTTMPTAEQLGRAV